MEFLKMPINVIADLSLPARNRALILLILGATLSGCGGKAPSIESLPSDAAPEQLAAAVDDLQSSMGDDEQTYAESFLYAAEYAKLESERYAKAGDSNSSRDKMLEAGKLYEEARVVADVIENDRVLKFPEDRSLGTISVRPWDFKAEFRELS